MTAPGPSASVVTRPVSLDAASQLCRTAVPEQPKASRRVRVIREDSTNFAWLGAAAGTVAVAGQAADPRSGLTVWLRRSACRVGSGAGRRRHWCAIARRGAIASIVGRVPGGEVAGVRAHRLVVVAGDGDRVPDDGAQPRLRGDVDGVPAAGRRCRRVRVVADPVGDVLLEGAACLDGHHLHSTADAEKWQVSGDRSRGEGELGDVTARPGALHGGVRLRAIARRLHVRPPASTRPSRWDTTVLAHSGSGARRGTTSGYPRPVRSCRGRRVATVRRVRPSTNPTWPARRSR